MNGLQLPHFFKYRQSVLYKLTVICRFSRFFGQKQKRGKFKLLNVQKAAPHEVRLFSLIQSNIFFCVVFVVAVGVKMPYTLKCPDKYADTVLKMHLGT